MSGPLLGGGVGLLFCQWFAENKRTFFIAVWHIQCFGFVSFQF
jgi:hypothetical protein